jgi:hypothetical protein
VYEEIMTSCGLELGIGPSQDSGIAFSKGKKKRLYRSHGGLLLSLKLN